MKIRWHRFNIYLLGTLAVAAVCGCQTSGDSKPKKLLSTLRLHLEVSRDGTKANEPVPVYRETARYGQRGENAFPDRRRTWPRPK